MPQKITNDKDIVIGEGCVPFCEKRNAWVIPGCSFVRSKKAATNIARNINRLIVANTKKKKKHGRKFY